MSVLNDIRFKFNQDNAITKIIIVNVAVFLLFSISYVLLFLFNAESYVVKIKGYLMLPASLQRFLIRPWSILSYMFLHDGLLHLVFNMLWLYWIGGLLQEYLGNTRTYQTYILGGIFGGIIFMLSYNLFPAFSSSVAVSYALGASAGVLSVVVAAATLLPDYRIMLILLGSVKLKYLALFSVILDLISIPQGNAGGHIAHLGGALFGFIFIKLIYSKKFNTNLLDKLFTLPNNLFKPKHKIKVTYKATYMRAEQTGKPSQQEIDDILDKISKNGYNSLSAKEKEKLFKASNQ